MDSVDQKILNIILTRRDGDPVGFPTIDRILLSSHEEFILSGLLNKKLQNLVEKGFIQSPPEQIGYSLTEKGLKLIT
ncbi:MAG: hypothetical protein GY816_10055 [Cytophagales bacterium]|nr:hypothetical protein [Cytophagales bacterium]